MLTEHRTVRPFLHWANNRQQMDIRAVNLMSHCRQPFKVDAIAIQDDLIVIGETSIKLTVVDETLTGAKVVGGSVVTLMMEPLNFSDLKIDGNFTVSYGTYENRNIYSNIKCERSDSVYNISCLSEPLKPGIPRTSLY